MEGSEWARSSLEPRGNSRAYGSDKWVIATSAIELRVRARLRTVLVRGHGVSWDFSDAANSQDKSEETALPAMGSQLAETASWSELSLSSKTEGREV